MQSILTKELRVEKILILPTFASVTLASPALDSQLIKSNENGSLYFSNNGEWKKLNEPNCSVDCDFSIAGSLSVCSINCPTGPVVVSSINTDSIFAANYGFVNINVGGGAGVAGVVSGPGGFLRSFRSLIVKEQNNPLVITQTGDEIEFEVDVTRSTSVIQSTETVLIPDEVWTPISLSPTSFINTNPNVFTIPGVQGPFSVQLNSNGTYISDLRVTFESNPNGIRGIRLHDGNNIIASILQPADPTTVTQVQLSKIFPITSISSLRVDVFQNSGNQLLIGGDVIDGIESQSVIRTILL